MGRDVFGIEMAGAHQVVAVRVLGQLMTSRGPIWEADTELYAKEVALAKAGLRLINAVSAQDDVLNAAGFRKLATAASVAELDLRGYTTTRLAATHGKWRNRWRRAQEAPVILKQERFDRVTPQWLLGADRAQQLHKRFRSLPHGLIDALADQQAVTVHVADLDAEPLAAMLFITHRPVVTYDLGWISLAVRQWGLHHRILIAAAAQFADQGYCLVDLGTVDTENAPGLARFKIGTGAAIRPLGGSWLRIRRPRG